MPELPDITIYVERLRALTTGATLQRLRIVSPFVLRTVTPPLSALEGATVDSVSAIGKRIVFELSSLSSKADVFIVVHLMIAGRLKWNASPPGKLNEGRYDIVRSIPLGNLGQSLLDSEHLTVRPGGQVGEPQSICHRRVFR